MSGAPAALALVLGLAAVLVGCGDQDDDLVDSLTRDNATALVADGTSPTGEDLDGMPDDDAGRVGWLLTAVAWDDESAEELTVGLRNAVEDDPDLLAAMVRGVSDADERVRPDLRDRVLGVLGEEPEAVRVTLAGDPPDDGVTLDRDALLDTFASVGFGSGPSRLEGDLRDDMSEGLLRDLPVPVPDGPPAVRAWDRAYPAAYRRWVQPLVLMYAAQSRFECDDVESCREPVTEEVRSAGRDFAGVVNGRIPEALLPGRIAAELVTEPDGTRTGLVDDELSELWADFRRREGYDLAELVLAEVAQR